jgi:acyl-CoA synthetase (AMP-forming)/AMP-acid ligase II
MTPTTTTLTYIDLLDRAVKLAGGRPALIDDTVTLTHGELASLTNRLARALIAKGFAPFSPYAVLSPNTSMALAAGRASRRWGLEQLQPAQRPGDEYRHPPPRRLPGAVLPFLDRPPAAGGMMAPKSVDFIDALPRSAVGKVLKRVLRDRYRQAKKDRI